MYIRVKLEELLEKRSMRLRDLETETGLALNNLSILKTGKAKAIRFSTLVEICKALDCQPGDLLEYVRNEKE